MNETFFIYKDFKAMDFFQNEIFINTALSPNEDEFIFWQKLAKAYPHLKSEIDLATIWLTMLKKQKAHHGKSSASQRWDRIQAQIPIYKNKQDRKDSMIKIGKWSAAIAVIILSMLTLREISQFGTVVNDTKFAERKALVLPDESVVQLNSNSRISYIRGWKSDKPREIWLTGEAMFDVKHTAIKNRLREQDLFVVHVGDISLTVLGTKFNVKHRRDHIAVTLIRGSLRITKNDGLLRLLKPGETFVYDKNGINQQLVRNDVAKVSSWTNGELNIEHSSLSNIIDVLQDNYGYEVILEDSTLLQKRLQGTIPVKNLEDILFVIKHTLDADIQLKNKQIIINSTYK